MEELKQEKFEFWKNYINELKVQGRTRIVTRWLSNHQIFGKVQKEANHDINVSDAFLKNAVELEDWHIV